MDCIESTMKSVEFGIDSYTILKEREVPSIKRSISSPVYIQLTTLESVDYLIVPSSKGYQVSLLHRYIQNYKYRKWIRKFLLNILTYSE
jgi:hypothetical protein